MNKRILLGVMALSVSPALMAYTYVQTFQNTTNVPAFVTITDTNGKSVVKTIPGQKKVAISISAPVKAVKVDASLLPGLVASTSAGSNQLLNGQGNIDFTISASSDNRLLLNVSKFAAVQ